MPERQAALLIPTRAAWSLRVFLAFANQSAWISAFRAEPTRSTKVADTDNKRAVRHSNSHNQVNKKSRRQTTKGGTFK